MADLWATAQVAAGVTGPDGAAKSGLAFGAPLFPVMVRQANGPWLAD
jgi:hypothetical protein